jgi:hypothetical protein
LEASPINNAAGRKVRERQIQPQDIFFVLEAAAESVSPGAPTRLKCGNPCHAYPSDATQLMGEFVPDRCAKMILIGLGMPVLKIANQKQTAPITDLWNISVCWNDDLD